VGIKHQESESQEGLGTDQVVTMLSKLAEGLAEYSIYSPCGRGIQIFKYDIVATMSEEMSDERIFPLTG
jgi:hypothetical protein